LNGESQGLINNLCFPSAVSADYAPEGRTLVSSSVIGDSAQPDLESRVQGELIQWFGAEAKSWQHLRTYRIIDALPDQSVQGYSPQSPVQLSERLFVCGDYTENASINGALLSGRKTADALIRAVSQSVAC
jgi:predicted NAD/FAD-dependent oxidoreductase